MERYHELVIEGRKGMALGFVHGYLAGRVPDPPTAPAWCTAPRSPWRSDAPSGLYNSGLMGIALSEASFDVGLALNWTYDERSDDDGQTIGFDGFSAAGGCADVAATGGACG